MSNKTSTNYARTERDSTESSLEKALETDEDIKFNYYVAFNHVTQRSASSLPVLCVCAELIVDYTSFRDNFDDNFQCFLDKMCDSDVGLVPNRDEKEGSK